MPNLPQSFFVWIMNNSISYFKLFFVFSDSSYRFFWVFASLLCLTFFSLIHFALFHFHSFGLPYTPSHLHPYSPFIHTHKHWLPDLPPVSVVAEKYGRKASWQKSMTNLDSVSKSRGFANKDPCSQSYGFSSGHVQT